LTEGAVERFVADRGVCYRRRLNRRGLGALLDYLRALSIVPAAPVTVSAAPLEVLLAEYQRYLVQERALAPESVRRYLPLARVFLASLPTPLEEALERLSAADISAFVLDQARRRSVADTKCVVKVLRSLLRFWFVAGKIRLELWRAVPTAVNRKLSTVPGRLAPGQAQQLHDSCRRSTPCGRRDYAMLLLLSRLGLRACEVAALQLRDIDFRAGELAVRGKGGRLDRLPLPHEVGEALADYLMHARPNRVAAQAVFVSMRAPFQPISPSAVRSRVAHACRRAGLERIGAHRLRHTVASDLLARGAGLSEIGQVLRHREESSTAIYAKVDHARLRTLAQPWPGGAL
jgi:site-specific recombinase XerD